MTHENAPQLVKDETMVEILCDQDAFEQAISDGKIVLGTALIADQIADLPFDISSAVPMKGKKPNPQDLKLNKVQPKNKLRRRNAEDSESSQVSESDIENPRNPVFHGHEVKQKLDGVGQGLFDEQPTGVRSGKHGKNKKNKMLKSQTPVKKKSKGNNMSRSEYNELLASGYISKPDSFQTNEKENQNFESDSDSSEDYFDELDPYQKWRKVESFKDNKKEEKPQSSSSNKRKSKVVGASFKMKSKNYVDVKRK